MKKTKVFNRNQLEEIIKKLGEYPLTKSGHGFREGIRESIFESATKSIKNYTDLSKKKPALGLISVVLAANRNYNRVVEPNLINIERDCPKLSFFSELKEMINKIGDEKFYELWGHKDKKKLDTLKEILDIIFKLKEKDTNLSDFEVMNKWANKANFEEDPISKIKNVGLATFQHLRMVFGANTIKPDLRVKQVLEFEFGINGLNDFDVIKKVEEFSRILNLEVLFLDQIFVKYGSSYFIGKEMNSIFKIAKVLKLRNVEFEIISEATGLNQYQIEKL